ncbi:phage integrase SAM-like domain-containing protein [Chryseobacterium sp. TY4]
MNAKISILLYAKKAKASNNGLIPIYMRITVDGKSLEISFKRFVQIEKWIHDLSRMKENLEEARSVNSYLNILKAKVYGAQKEIIQDNELVTAETLRCKLLGTEKRARMLVSIFLDHNDKMETLVGKEFALGTLGRYRTCLSHIQEFLKWQYRVSDIDIKKIDFAFLNDFEFFLRTEKSCNNNSAVNI